jgi:hypothetical protein
MIPIEQTFWRFGMGSLFTSICTRSILPVHTKSQSQVSNPQAISQYAVGFDEYIRFKQVELDLQGGSMKFRAEDCISQL